MARHGLPLGLAVVSLVCASGVRADEALTRAAEREKARRAEQGAGRKAKPAEKYTDDDLKAMAEKGRKNGAPAASPESPAAPAAEGGTSLSEQLDQTLQTYKQSVAAKRAEIAGIEAQIAEAQARIAALRAERSHPTRLTEVNRDRSINNDIAAVNADIDLATKSLAEAKQQLEDLIEEARQAGVPYSQLD